MTGPMPTMRRLGGASICGTIMRSPRPAGKPVRRRYRRIGEVEWFGHQRRKLPESATLCHCHAGAKSYPYICFIPRLRDLGGLVSNSYNPFFSTSRASTLGEAVRSRCVDHRIAVTMRALCGAGDDGNGDVLSQSSSLA